MNKLNSPIVILCLIIATLINSILSVSTFIQNKNKHDNNMKNESSVAVDTDITETTINSNESIENDDFHIVVYDTTLPSLDNLTEMNIHELYDIAYSSYTDIESIKDAYMGELYWAIPLHYKRMYSVSCRNDGCSITVDDNTILYNADIGKNIIEQFKTQKKLTADILVNMYETDSGRIVGEPVDLPEFVMAQFNENGNITSIYEMDSNLSNYLHSLT